LSGHNVHRSQKYGDHEPSNGRENLKGVNYTYMRNFGTEPKTGCGNWDLTPDDG